MQAVTFHTRSGFYVLVAWHTHSNKMHRQRRERGNNIDNTLDNPRKPWWSRLIMPAMNFIHKYCHKNPAILGVNGWANKKVDWKWSISTKTSFMAKGEFGVGYTEPLKSRNSGLILFFSFKITSITCAHKKKQISTLQTPFKPSRKLTVDTALIPVGARPSASCWWCVSPSGGCLLA